MRPCIKRERDGGREERRGGRSKEGRKRRKDESSLKTKSAPPCQTPGPTPCDSSQSPLLRGERRHEAKLGLSEALGVSVNCATLSVAMSWLASLKTALKLLIR